MKSSLLMLLIIFLVGSTACNALLPQAQIPQASEMAAPDPYPASEQTYPYPYPYVLEAPPLYPDPGMIPPTPTYIPPPTPTPDPTLGRIDGSLFEGTSPVQISLYLAEIQADENGKEIAARYDPQNSPREETSPDGSFSFVNVKPGRYALILYTGMNSFLLNVPDKNEAIIFTVEAGKTFDLGKIVYDDLPLE